MASARHCRIYVKRTKQLLDFMWVDVSADGTIVMEFRFSGYSEVELVLDKELGKMRPPQVVTTQVFGPLKLTFHATGHYKLTAQMGKAPDSIDRATVVGPRLSDICKPRRMVEILLPANLPDATKHFTKNDISLDITTAPPGPLRCVISCMSRKHFKNVILEENRFVDTSVWECVHALETEKQVWSWVLRRSINDTEFPSRFVIFLAGDVKWGKQQCPVV